MPRWASQYPAAPTSAAPGNVRTQAYTIRRAQIHRTACQPRVAPTPEIAPAIARMVQHGQGVLCDIRSFFPQLFYFVFLSVESWKRLEHR
jgi:hypothetical protein